MRELPRVTFVVPVHSAADDLASCLASITRQDYPDSLVDLLVTYSGSDPEILEAAHSAGVTVIRDVQGAAETCLDLGIERARGDIIFIVAANSGLPRTDWARLMTRPFVDQDDVFGVCAQFAVAPTDNALTRYACRLHADPFTWFVYGDASNPRYYRHASDVVEARNGYVIYGFSGRRHPYVPLEYGFGFRKRPAGYQMNECRNIRDVCRIIKVGSKIACVQDAGVYHRPVAGLGDYMSLFRKSFAGIPGRLACGVARDLRDLSVSRRLRVGLFELYGLTGILPLLDSLTMTVCEKDRAMLWHGPASIVTSWVILRQYIAGTRALGREAG